MTLVGSPNAGEYAPTPLEKYILWASAWLHDLGMQSLLGNKLGGLLPKDYAQIRREHPNESFQEILTNATQIGFPDDRPLIQVIALAAQSHGTNYYQQAVDQLRPLSRVRNEAVRGPMIAAALLMADELDLHYQRALTPAAHAELASVSEAHAAKHQHVTSCEIRHDPQGVVTVHLGMFQYPRETDQQYEEFEFWITDKLRQQIALVEHEFTGGFGGRLALSRSIVVQRVPAMLPGPTLSDGLLSHVIADNENARLINHKRAVVAAREGIQSGLTVRLQGRLAGAIDTDGREDLRRALVAAETAASNHLILHSDCLYESLGVATLADVLGQLLTDATGFSYVDGVQDRLAALEGWMDQAARPVFIAVSSIDLLPSDELQEWTSFVRRWEAQWVTSVIYTCSPTAAIESDDVVVSLASLEQDHVENHLRRYTTRSAAQAEAAASLDYWSYRRLRDGHMLGLVHP